MLFSVFIMLDANVHCRFWFKVLVFMLDLDYFEGNLVSRIYTLRSCMIVIALLKNVIYFNVEKLKYIFFKIFFIY